MLQTPKQKVNTTDFLNYSQQQSPVIVDLPQIEETPEKQVPAKLRILSPRIQHSNLTSQTMPNHHVSSDHVVCNTTKHVPGTEATIHFSDALISNKVLRQATERRKSKKIQAETPVYTEGAAAEHSDESHEAPQEAQMSQTVEVLVVHQTPEGSPPVEKVDKMAYDDLGPQKFIKSNTLTFERALSKVAKEDKLDKIQENLTEERLEEETQGGNYE